MSKPHPFDEGGHLPVHQDGGWGTFLANEDALRLALTKWFDGLGSLDERAGGLRQALAARSAIGDVTEELERVLAEEMTSPWLETPAGTLKRDRRGGYSSWDSEPIWRELLDQVRSQRVDRRTGEIRGFDEGAEMMLRAVCEVLGSPTFKVTALRKRGIDPDEVRSTSPSRYRAKFVD